MQNLLSQGDIRNTALPPALRSLSGEAFLQGLLSTLIAIALAAGGIFFFFQFLTGGIDWINSGGDKQKLEGARGKLASALIGLILLFSAFAVARLIQAIFGINILNLTIPSFF